MNKEPVLEALLDEKPHSYHEIYEIINKKELPKIIKNSVARTVSSYIKYLRSEGHVILSEDNKYRLYKQGVVLTSNMKY